MLKEICKLVANDDDFVGLHFIGNKPEVVFPRGYAISSDDDAVRCDILSLLSAIQQFSGQYKGNKNTLTNGDNSLDFPLLSYQYIILDYLQNGYYTEKEVRYIEAPKGKINWKRTIQIEKPHLDGDNIVYLNFMVKTNRIKSDHLLTLIHEYCVYESFRKLGWLYVTGSVLPQKPRLPLNKTLFLSVLSSELSQTFNDNKKRLLRSMINIIAEVSESSDDNTKAAFGVYRFEYVWEAMVDYVFGESNREQYYPKAHWYIVTQNGFKVESSELRPDTIMKHNGKIYILDAKYYKYGVTRIPAHLPTTDSIQKQITYGDYIAEKEYAPKDKIFNAFIMPYSSLGADAIPYSFASVGLADWRSYVTSPSNYEFVLGILMDTKHLIASYVRHNIDEIERLSQFIEDSLNRYKLTQRR